MAETSSTDPSLVHRRWKTYGALSISAKILGALSAIAAAFSLLIPMYFFSTPTETTPSMLIPPELNPLPVAILVLTMAALLVVQRFAENRRGKLAAIYLELTGDRPEDLNR